jgi:hypothetical protein
MEKFRTFVGSENLSRDCAVDPDPDTRTFCRVHLTYKFVQLTHSFLLKGLISFLIT